MNTISDETFRKELDLHLKNQKILKKERNKTIERLLLMPIDQRDEILEINDVSARAFIEEQFIKKNVPLEATEQKNLVEWFRATYPHDIIMMIRNDGTRTMSERSEQVILGLYKGASDLYVPHLHLWIEMKRIKNSKPSDHQLDFGKKVEGYGDSFIIGYGFDDAKTKLLKVQDEHDKR